MDPVLGSIVVVGIIAAAAVFYMHKKNLSAAAVEQQAAAKIAELLGRHANPPAAASPSPQATVAPAAPAPSNAVPVALVRQPDGTVAPADGPLPVGTPVETLPPGTVVVLPDPNPPGPVNRPPPLPKPPVVAPPPEFSTHPDGSIWWRDPVRGIEMGPCSSLDDAIKLRDAVAARDWAQDPNNPTSQQATADVPGLGFPVMAKAQVDAILANFDAAIAGGHEDKAWFQLTSQEHFALQNRGMTRLQINAKINQYNP